MRTVWSENIITQTNTDKNLNGRPFIKNSKIQSAHLSTTNTSMQGTKHEASYTYSFIYGKRSLTMVILTILIMNLQINMKKS
jgi:hypothetical protein